MITYGNIIMVFVSGGYRFSVLKSTMIWPIVHETVLNVVGSYYNNMGWPHCGNSLCWNHDLPKHILHSLILYTIGAIILWSHSLRVCVFPSAHCWGSKAAQLLCPFILPCQPLELCVPPPMMSTAQWTPNLVFTPTSVLERTFTWSNPGSSGVKAAQHFSSIQNRFHCHFLDNFNRFPFFHPWFHAPLYLADALGGKCKVCTGTFLVWTPSKQLQSQRPLRYASW